MGKRAKAMTESPSSPLSPFPFSLSPNPAPTVQP
jgi:hypothetical protein